MERSHRVITHDIHYLHVSECNYTFAIVRNRVITEHRLQPHTAALLHSHASLPHTPAGRSTVTPTCVSLTVTVTVTVTVTEYVSKTIFI